MNIYYVYALIDPRDSKIFYIGKGKNKRAWVHMRPSMLKADNHKTRKIKKLLSLGLQPVVKLLYENLEEEQAYNLEVKLIEEYDLKNLTNCYGGGKGARQNKNFSGKKHTEETKQAISKHQRENNCMAGEKWHRSEEGKQSFAEKMQEKLGGIPRDEETKRKISESLKGYQWPEEEKRKRSEGMKRVWAERKARKEAENGYSLEREISR